MEKLCIYIINDGYLESCYNDNDIDAFVEAVNDDDLMCYDFKEFETENEALLFLDGLFYGCNERNPCGKIVLCSWRAWHKPYINALLNV